MREELRSHPAFGELCQLVTEIGMISHVPGTSYEGKVARDTSESVGGGRPSGAEGEFKPRAPRSPLVEGDAGSEKRWAEFEDELAAWLACYQRKTPSYFARQLERCESERRLVALRDEAADVLVSWRRTPIPVGDPPEFGSAQWKRYIGESREDVGVLATRFSVTRRYIYKVRAAYREAA